MGATMSKMNKIITYSRNVFLPVSNICRNRCAYCGFRGAPRNGGWLLSESEVLNIAWVGRLARCTEALITTGEKPDAFPEIRSKLREWGFRDFVCYVQHLCKQLLRLGLLPHVNLGVLNKHELRKLKRFCASMGLMLECSAPLPAHKLSPGKEPSLRVKTIRAAGQLKIPFTTGILIGIGESMSERIESLHLIKSLHDRYGHIQEVIIQPFEPKAGTPMQNQTPPEWQIVVKTIHMATEILGEIPIQFPPNLLYLYGDLENRIKELIRAGVRDFGGISPITPDFINPSARWPEIAKLRQIVASAGFSLRRRLPLYPHYLESGWVSCEVRKIAERISGSND
jgi:7,8-didemethyl-8-hydroxy-5-deazariboflavin synthase CofG subunit